MENISDEDLNELLKSEEEQDKLLEEFPGFLEIEEVIKKYGYSSLICLAKTDGAGLDMINKRIFAHDIPKTEEELSATAFCMFKSLGKYLGIWDEDDEEEEEVEV